VKIFEKPYPGIGRLVGLPKFNRKEFLAYMSGQLQRSREALETIQTAGWLQIEKIYREHIEQFDRQIVHLGQSAHKNAETIQRITDMRDAMEAMLRVVDELREKPGKYNKIVRDVEHKSAELEKRNRM
jgi:hypothetical protein